jgi:hypothetical protein
MAIMGGRYLEAEKLTNELILTNPNSETFFLLGTIKSNLLLSKGRDYNEVIYCFEKSYSLSDNKEETNNNIGAFLFCIYQQLNKLQENLKDEAGWNLLKTVVGVATSYIGAELFEKSESAFGALTAGVTAGIGVGMTFDGISEIGSIAAQFEYVKNLKNRLEEYLTKKFPSIKSKFQSNINFEILREIQNKYSEKLWSTNEIANIIEKLEDTSQIKIKVNSSPLLIVLKTPSLEYVVFCEENIKVLNKIPLIGVMLTELSYDEIENIKLDGSDFESKLEISFRTGTQMVNNGSPKILNNYKLTATLKRSLNPFKSKLAKQINQEIKSAIGISESRQIAY